MESNNYDDNRVEFLLYILIAVIGIALIWVSSYETDGSFKQNLTLGIGSNMAVVTIIFLIFRFFRRTEKQDTKSITSNSQKDDVEKIKTPANLRGRLANRASPRVGDTDRSFYRSKDEK